MSFSDTTWMCFGCHDLVDDHRTHTYIRHAQVNKLFDDMDCCPTLVNDCGCDDDIPDPDWSDPATDDVCWYDALIPESAGFLGLMVTDIVGPWNSSYRRESISNATIGTTLGRYGWDGKSISVKATLFATSCASMEYGIQYLKTALERHECVEKASCQASLGRCGSSSLKLRVQCPNETDSDDGLREYLGVSVIDSVELVPRPGRSCCCFIQDVIFNLQTDNPDAFTGESTILDADADDTLSVCFDWEGCCPPSTDGDFCFDWSDCCPHPCDCDQCGSDPLCNCGDLIPQLTTDDTRDNCFCEPLQRTIQCHCDADLPNHIETVYRVQISSGFDLDDEAFMRIGLRNVRVKLYENRAGLPCPGDDADAYAAWECIEPCGVLEVPYVPHSSVLTVDGRDESITLLCNNKCIPAQNLVFGSEGTSNPFPLRARCKGLIVCVEWDQQNTVYVTGANSLASHVKVDKFLAWR